MLVRPGTTDRASTAGGWGTVDAMRRPQTASGLAAVMASLFVATLAAGPVDAAAVRRTVAPPATFAAKACTRWSSESVPPATIRVLRTKRKLVPRNVAGTVQEVDFRDYVATTMAVEWPERYPIETIKAGAVATRQFAWYHVIHPRGKTVEVPVEGEEDEVRRVCYDVVDTTADQYYYPEKYGPGAANGPGPKIRRALAETWEVTLRKYRAATRSSRFFLTGYRAGTSSRCGADANGFKLFHNSTRACGRDGLTYREILYRYLRPNLEIATTGRHDVIGTRHGDAASMVLDAKGAPVAHLWTLVQPAAGAVHRAGVRIASQQLVGYQSADMDRDGKEDLVWLIQTGPRQGRIRVALSDGNGYGDPRTWYAGDVRVPLDGARLVVGDFHADGRPDVGILARGSSSGTVRLVVARKKAGNALAAPSRWWTGNASIESVVAAWAGDLSGDGRADLIIRQHPDSGGVRFRTAVTKSPTPSGGDRMVGFKLAWETTKVKPSRLKAVPADANRDGREDVLLLIGGAGRPRVERLTGQPSGRFKRVHIWTAPKSARIPVTNTRLGAADADHDGRTDLVLFSEHAEGTRIRVLKTRYDSMATGLDIVEPIDYDDVRPY